MKVSNFLLSTLTTAAIVGAIGLTYAQNSTDSTVGATPPSTSTPADSTNTNPSSMSNAPAASGSSTMSNSPSSSTTSNSSAALDERAPRADRN